MQICERGLCLQISDEHRSTAVVQASHVGYKLAIAEQLAVVSVVGLSICQNYRQTYLSSGCIQHRSSLL